MNQATANDRTVLQAGQHSISYAYPSSEFAARLGRSGTGCYVLCSAGGEEPMESYAAASEKAKAMGTEPHRWSMDHPANARFLSPLAR